jgi:hypothetical protein
MRTLAVLTAIPLTEPELRSMVLELGGEWREDYGTHQGIVVREGGEILLTLDNSVIDACSDDDDPPWPRSKMGFDPKSQIVIGVVRYHDAEKDRIARVLARDVAVQLSTKWRGYIDWDEVVPP